MGHVLHLASTRVVCLNSFPWSKIQALTWPCSLLMADKTSGKDGEAGARWDLEGPPWDTEGKTNWFPEPKPTQIPILSWPESRSPLRVWLWFDPSCSYAQSAVLIISASGVWDISSRKPKDAHEKLHLGTTVCKRSRGVTQEGTWEGNEERSRQTCAWPFLEDARKVVRHSFLCQRERQLYQFMSLLIRNSFLGI